MEAEQRHYRTLRSLVGVLGVSIPIVLPLGVWLAGDPPVFRESMSAYHASAMRDPFVALVFAVGVFLFAYPGYVGCKVGPFEADRLVGNVASLCAATVALVPSRGSELFHVLHLAGGTGMFASLAIFSLFLFTRTDGDVTPRKRVRNRVYRASGGVIVVCMTLFGIYYFGLQDTQLSAYQPILVLETVMLFAFGIAWGVKGGWALRDQ